MLKYILTVLVLFAASFTVSAQVSATASVSATISNPLSIYQSMNMEWDSITVSKESGGSIVMDPNGKESTKGGVQITNPNGAPASFTVAGQGGYTYSITLPKDPIALDDENVSLLNITNFTTSPIITGPLLQSGTQTINVGATLNVDKAEESGTLEAEIPFDIQVNYN